MSKLDGVNYSDIRSMASQDGNSITSRVARASASSTKSRSTRTKSTHVGHSEAGVDDRMTGTLNDPSRHGKAAAAQDCIDPISNGEVHV